MSFNSLNLKRFHVWNKKITSYILFYLSQYLSVTLFFVSYLFILSATNLFVFFLSVFMFSFVIVARYRSSSTVWGNHSIDLFRFRTERMKFTFVVCELQLGLYRTIVGLINVLNLQLIFLVIKLSSGQFTTINFNHLLCYLIFLLQLSKDVPFGV